jgi:uncharacterized membrane protein
MRKLILSVFLTIMSLAVAIAPVLASEIGPTP